jgi:hypothetical protein
LLHSHFIQTYVALRVANEDRNIMTIRLPPDQMRRLDRAARQRHQTKQSFVAEFTMAAVSELEATAKLGKLPPLPPIGSAQETPTTESGGLGISAAMRKPKEQSTEESAAPPPVVVNVGNTMSTKANGAPVSELERLAFYVIKGDDFLRDARKRIAFDMLRASAETDEEYNVLVAQLEQTIAVKTKVVEENTGVNKLARFAFDKLTTLLRGE